MKEDKQLEVVSDGGLPMALGEAKKTLQYITDVSKDILTEGVDYGTIPGTNKPCLFKPGAEKLCMAWRLSPEFTIVDKVEDHDKEWEYAKGKTARGYFRYTIRCNLIYVPTGEVRGAQIGICDSYERGREASPANTIIKMAQKRAYVGATLLATFMSERFTQDVEDYRGDQNPSESHDPNTEKQDEGFPSKFGTEDKPSACNFCGEWHVVKGDMITKTDKLYKGKATYGAVACRDKQESIDRSEGDTTSIIPTIKTLEKLVGSQAGWDNDTVKEQRIEYLGVMVLAEAQHNDLASYLKHLEGMANAHDEELGF